MPPTEIGILASWAQIASMVQSIVVSVAAVFTLLGFNEWRRQLVGKRKAELAEEALVTCYGARDALTFARGRGLFPGDGETRSGSESESEELKRRRNAYFVPIERLSREHDLFAKLNAQRYAFGAFFGADSMKAFETISGLRQEIIVAASVLVQVAQDDLSAREHLDSTIALRNTLGWGPAARPDELDNKLAAAILEIERLCKPILQARR